jgi:hypothetical protein
LKSGPKWGAQAVSESALTRTVTELSQALGDDAGEPRLLETIPKRGYRLIGSVSAIPADAAVIAPRQVGGINARTMGWFAVAAIALTGALVAWMWFRNPSVRSRCSRSIKSVTISIASTWLTVASRSHSLIAWIIAHCIARLFRSGRSLPAGLSAELEERREPKASRARSPHLR